MTHEEAITLLAGAFGRHLFEGVMSYTIPVSWGVNADGKWLVHSNGTAFLLNCGQKSFLVTAGHVLEGYREARKDASVRSFVGQLEFDFEARLIDFLGSRVLDIATFAISEDEISKLKKRVAYGPRDWPPPAILEDSGVLFGGYPGQERAQRTEHQKQIVNFGLYAALTPVSGTNERHFTCVLEHDEWVDYLGTGLPDREYDLGGISGGPAFEIHESDAGVFTWTIAGVVYNAVTSLGEIVQIHHIRFIQPDGKLIAPL